MVLNVYFIGTEDSFFQFDVDGGYNKSFPVNLNLRCMIMLLLMLSGKFSQILGLLHLCRTYPLSQILKVEQALGLYIEMLEVWFLNWI